MRTDHEVLLVVHRPGAEFLVLLRSLGGFWHLVSGGVEDDEAPEDAAWRELSEETRLVPERITSVPLELGYRKSKGTWITVHPFAAAAPAGWEPVLDHEHVDHRWCSEEAALALLKYPEPRDAISYVVRTLEPPS
jgi:dihydroneopterin triphosphate diphosphatase